jgi:hypothetical protein
LEEDEEAITYSVFFLMLARDSSATNTFNGVIGCAEEGFNQVTKQGREGRRDIIADGHGGSYKDVVMVEESRLSRGRQKLPNHHHLPGSLLVQLSSCMTTSWHLMPCRTRQGTSKPCG